MNVSAIVMMALLLGGCASRETGVSSVPKSFGGVWVIVADGGMFQREPDGSKTFIDIYWTGSSWSRNWKDAKQYPLGTDINYVVPNGAHCCYVENPVRIDPATGKRLGFGPPERGNP